DTTGSSRPGRPHPTEPAIEPLHMMRLDRDLLESLMHTSFALRRAAVSAVEKIAHRLREIPQRLLLYSLRPCCQPLVFGGGRCQLSALLVVAGRLAVRLPVLMLLDRQVPHIPGMATVFDQHHCLLSSRKQPITRHPCNLTVITDNPLKEDAASPP